MTDVYWAAEAVKRPDTDSTGDIGARVRERWERFWRGAEDRGLVSIWRRNVRAYYGQDPDGGYGSSSGLAFDGEQGELIVTHSGDYRQLVRQMHTLATSARPHLEATAASNDPEAISQTITARQVLEYDLDEGAGGLEEVLERCHERALVAGEGYVIDEWDPEEGEAIGIAPAYMPDAEDAMPEVQQPERVVHEGGPRARYKGPWDVARDLDVQAGGSHRWYIVRDRVHRWELAARYPEHARTILGAPDAAASSEQLWPGDQSTTGSDYVELLTLYHLPTAALPTGRRVEVCCSAVLTDVDHPGEEPLVHVDVPGEEMIEATGYSDAWSLLVHQLALDGVEGAMLTTHDAGAVPNWIAKKGQNVNARDLSQRLRVIEYDGDPGDAPPGLAERPEVRDSDRQLAEYLRGNMQRLSGINATVRGETDANVKSGAHAALIASMAVQANSGQQRSYGKVQRSVLNGRLRLYQQHATEKRLIELTGRDSVGHVMAFTADDLAQVRRVRIELGSAYLRTVQGKKDVADTLLERFPAVITPDRYLTMLQTGRLDDVMNREATHKVNAKRENDALRDWQVPPEVAAGMVEMTPDMMPVTAAMWDHHAIHIREHLEQLDDPAVRLDRSPKGQAYQTVVLQHVEEHAALWVSARPEILSATGQDPAPSTLMGPGPGAMGPGGPPPPSASGPAEPPPDMAVPGANGPMEGASLPQAPENPLNGQQQMGAGSAPPMGG